MAFYNVIFKNLGARNGCAAGSKTIVKLPAIGFYCRRSFAVPLSPSPTTECSWPTKSSHSFPSECFLGEYCGSCSHFLLKNLSFPALLIFHLSSVICHQTEQSRSQIPAHSLLREPRKYCGICGPSSSSLFFPISCTLKALRIHFHPLIQVS